MIDLDALPYVESPNKHAGRREAIRLLVMHTPQTPETNTAAEGVANYFARPSTGASTHLVGDVDSIIRCVPDGDTAWGAAGANADGLHYELAGYAEQDAREWADPFSQAAIGLAAQAFQAWAHRHGIPVRKLTVEQVRDGEAGICGHADVYAAFGEGDYRSDPGAAFPWDQFMRLVAGEVEEDEDVRDYYTVEDEPGFNYTYELPSGFVFATGAFNSDGTAAKFTLTQITREQRDRMQADADAFRAGAPDGGVARATGSFEITGQGVIG